MAEESQSISSLSSLNNGGADPLAVLKGIEEGAVMINKTKEEYDKVHKTFLDLAGGDENKAKDYELYAAGLTGVGAVGGGYYGIKNAKNIGKAIIKNPIESAAVAGGTILGVKAVGAVTDRLGYTTDISDKINQYDPTILGVSAEDAAKYFTLGGVGYKNAKSTFKGFNELTSSESYLADIAQEERMNRLLNMYGKTSSSELPRFYSDYAAKGSKGFAESIESTASMAGKATGEVFEKSSPFLNAISKSSGLKTAAKYSAILGKYTKLLPEISMVWDSVNAAVYAAQGDNVDAALKAFEVADQALWLLGPEVGIASLGVNYLIDTQIDKNRKKLEEKNAGQGKNKKGITINEKGNAIIPKNADALTQEEAIKYATKGREILENNGKWYLVDENKEKRKPEKIEISASKNTLETPPEVTLDLNYTSPKPPTDQNLLDLSFDTPKPLPKLKVPPIPPAPSVPPPPFPKLKVPPIQPVLPPLSLPTPTPRPTLSVSPTPSTLQTQETRVEVPNVIKDRQVGGQQDSQTLVEIRDILNNQASSGGAGNKGINIIGGDTSSNQTTHIHVGVNSVQEHRKNIRSWNYYINH